MMEPTATGGPTWQPAGRNQLARNERTPGSIAVGVKSGSVIGSLFDAHQDRTSAGRQSLSIAATLIEMQPQGGPYKNRHLSKDVLRLSGYPRIGDPRMPDAGCLHPPGAENTVQFWYPTKNAIGPAIRDAAKYSPIHAADGSVLTRWLFVIVQIKVDSRFQLRCYPDLSQRRQGRALRPNHAQLTDGSRVLALLGGNAMHVYAAGELYVTADGYLKAVTPRTGHYFDGGHQFDGDVVATTATALQTLGYSIDSVSFIHDWRWTI